MHYLIVLLLSMGLTNPDAKWIEMDIVVIDGEGNPVKNVLVSDTSFRSSTATSDKNGTCKMFLPGDIEATGFLIYKKGHKKFISKKFKFEHHPKIKGATYKMYVTIREKKTKCKLKRLY
jgi:hypothetical protein